MSRANRGSMVSPTKDQVKCVNYQKIKIKKFINYKKHQVQSLMVYLWTMSKPFPGMEEPRNEKIKQLNQENRIMAIVGSILDATVAWPYLQR
jgi:hypothetical protein